MRFLLFDLDGVLRRFDPAHGIALERAHGLPPGFLPRAAFTGPYVDAVVTGAIRRAQWIAAAGAVVGSVPAMSAFLGDHGAADPQMVALARAIRAGGLPIGLLTNATDTLPDELAHLGLTEDFDAVFSSAALGHAKPDPAIFAAVLAALDLPAAAVGFIDDRPENAAAAAAVGMAAHHFTGIGPLRRWLALRGGAGGW